MSIEVKSEGAFIAKRHFQSHKNGGGGTYGGNRMNGNRTNPSTVNVSDGSNNSASARNKIIRCYKCKQIGHFKNRCPHTEKVKTNAFSVFLTKGFSQTDWHLDSGASTHLVSNKNLLSNICFQPKIKEIIVANKTIVPVECSGDLEITTCNECIGVATLENGVYKLHVKTEVTFAESVNVSSSTWHRRLAHLNATDMQKLKNGAVEEARDVITARDVVVMENTDDSSATTITIDESRPPKEAEEEHDSVSEEQDTSDNPMDETFIPNESSNDTDDSYCDTLSPDDLDVLPTQCDTNLPEKRVRRKPDYYNVASMCVEIAAALSMVIPK
ncbi:unnamed protein product [Danaus chrysippus]|uniref:(African queen) hypothetical protein n=1 Tax=Danaus chrysippus TaxID=151541 RepID=A0A8J2QK47_9NEOP|nr:unnamed protein product [Danaus chrysippus]